MFVSAIAALGFGAVGLQSLLDRRVRVEARSGRRIPAHGQE